MVVFDGGAGVGSREGESFVGSCTVSSAVGVGAGGGGVLAGIRIVVVVVERKVVGAAVFTAGWNGVIVTDTGDLEITRG